MNFGGRACKIDFCIEYDQVELIWDLSLEGSQENYILEHKCTNSHILLT